jgi:hypothetical protein
VRLVLFSLTLLVGAALWAFRPAPAGACSCVIPAIMSQLQPVAGSTMAPAMCLISDRRRTALAPCDAGYLFEDEYYYGGER